VIGAGANVFVRTDKAATVQRRYTTDPTVATYPCVRFFMTAAANDFTKIIPVGNLAAETTYYLDITINHVQ